MMKKCRIITALMLGMLGATASAQTGTDSLTIHYEEGHSELNLTMGDNARQLSSFMERVRKALDGDSTKVVKVESFTAKGYCSPTSTSIFNDRLSEKRADRVATLLRQFMMIPDSVVKYSWHGIDWQTLQQKVELGNMPFRYEVLSIIRNIPVVEMRNGHPFDIRKHYLQTLDGGTAWKYMFDNYFPAMRRTLVKIRYHVEPRQMKEDELPQDTTQQVDFFEQIPLQDEVQNTCSRSFAVKTNLLYDAVGIGSLGMELKASKHSSFSLMATYNALKYGGAKYKNFSFQPEYRYWFNRTFQGAFISANLVWGGFNIDKLHIGGLYGKHRQGHFAGGGVGVGYHLVLSCRFRMDFTLNADAVRCSYHRYTNGDCPCKEGKFTSVAFLPIGTGVSLVFML